ncbi:hypothetical protein BKA70DRAFT_1282795 [Coprinopsis sp. MPI-PUGE-AT-0042]|nr:hypothetical protein BKA70DRAFT_1282795 [Coprinopsis sp. MPI-PUGE-AT-0042]
MACSPLGTKDQVFGSMLFRCDGKRLFQQPLNMATSHSAPALARFQQPVPYDTSSAWAFEASGTTCDVHLLHGAKTPCFLVSCRRQCFQDDFSVLSSLANQKSPRPSTVRHKRRQTHSEPQRRSHLLYLLERPPQIDISRSLAYASHVLENAESPAVDLLFVKQFASELIATTFSFLESIYDGSAHVQPNLIRTFASWLPAVA